MVGHLCLHGDSEVSEEDACGYDVSGFSHGFDLSQGKEDFSGASSLDFGFEGATQAWSFMPGLMHSDGVLCEAGTRVDVSELLSPEPRRFSLWRPQISTSLSHPDSVDGAVEF